MMYMRRGYSDVLVEDAVVKVILDISGLDPNDLSIVVSTTRNSVVIKHKPTAVVQDISVPVHILEKNIEWTVNNGVLEVTVRRCLT
jgi:HSP20 family molecular chaperone IbpA